MTKFEDSSPKTPLPDPQVDAFKLALRRELVEESQRRVLQRWRSVAFAAIAASLMLASALGWFVVRPEVPQRLRVALGGAPTPEAPAEATPPSVADTFDLAAWQLPDVEPLAAADIERVTVEQVVAVREVRLRDGSVFKVSTELWDGDRVGARTAAPDSFLY